MIIVEKSIIGSYLRTQTLGARMDAFTPNQQTANDGCGLEEIRIMKLFASVQFAQKEKRIAFWCPQRPTMQDSLLLQQTCSPPQAVFMIYLEWQPVCRFSSGLWSPTSGLFTRNGSDWIQGLLHAKHDLYHFFPWRTVVKSASKPVPQGPPRAPLFPIISPTHGEPSLVTCFQQGLKEHLAWSLFNGKLTCLLSHS